MNTKPYLGKMEVIALAFLLATPLQAQSLVGGYSDVVGLGAIGGIIVFLFAWGQLLRRQLRRIEPLAGIQDSPTETQPKANRAFVWDDEHEILKTLLDHASDQIYFKDRDSRFRWCCAAVANRFGVTQEYLVGKTDFDFFDEAHARPAFEDEQNILRTGVAFHGKIEKEVLKDGTIKWALTSKMPLRNKAGEIIGTFGISKDISELKRTEAALERERDLLSTLMSSTPDMIYFKDLQSRFVRVSQSEVLGALSRARAKYDATCTGNESGLPEHLAILSNFGKYIIGKTDFDFYPEDRARAAYDDEQEIIRSGKPLVCKLETSVDSDGRTIWLLTTKMPWRSHDGQIVGTFGISKDATFLKEAEAKLETAHKQLVDSSRVAGMAEVATTVLHNVGNVLNSVNISASLVAEKVKNSKTINLTRASEMLREHEANLAEFLTKDPKGAKLPSYFATLAETLSNEQSEMLGELTLLCANIEHIKEIVAMQQAYAKVAGLQERLKPAELVEDALRLNAGAVERHHVQVIREFTDTSMILVDKHKVLQILVNLIRNAKYALESNDLSDKKLVLRVEPGETMSVKISVIDNGVGIAPENLTRIFEHGFTTRKNGHGFALHSGALAAREMGGSLTGCSAGFGKGATFTLELPFHPPEAN